MIRNLATLQSNKSRLGASGACESVMKVILRNPTKEDAAKYGFRALGHLANQHPDNKAKFIEVLFLFCFSFLLILVNTLGSSL